MFLYNILCRVAVVSICLVCTVRRAHSSKRAAATSDGRVGEIDGRKTVRLSDPAATAAGLLLCARRAGVIDRLLHSRRSATAAPQQVNADGVTSVDEYPHPTLRYA